MVVGLSVAISSTSHSTMMVIFREVATSTAVTYRRSDIVAVSIVVTVILVVVIVVVVNRIVTMMMIMIPRINESQVVVRTVPAPAVVKAVVIPIR